MAQKIMVTKYGGPEVMELVDFEPQDPAPGNILIENKAVGMNFIDCYQRSGLYPRDLPFTPGSESAGTVLAVGEGVEHITVGDRVATSDAMGAYASHREFQASSAIKLPDYISEEDAVALLVKGLTARYLIFDTYEVKQGTSLLTYAASGGVGSVLCPWAKHLGARVIGVVSTPQKAELAKANGCDLVLIDGQDDVIASCKSFTEGKGVDVVYDSIGKDTFEQSLKCLRPRGMMVSFGNASGPVAVPSLGILNQLGSLYLTRPGMEPYYPDAEAMQKGALEVFEAKRDGIIAAQIGQTYALNQAKQAHADLEARKTTGATIIRP